MAQITSVKLVDDRDGSAADETIEFNLDERGPYEIDLSAENAAKLRDALAPFVAAARRVNTGPQRRSTSSAGPRRDLTEVRTWLRENGYQVSERGRISGDLMAAYESGTPAPAQLNDATPPAGETHTETAPEEKPKRNRKAKDEEQVSEGEDNANVVAFRSAANE